MVFNEKGACAIIDPGCYFDHERKELTDFIETNKLAPKCLLNTHCHLDHVFGNKFVAEKYNLELQIHPNEKVMLEYAPVSGEKWGLPFENYQGKLIFLEEDDIINLDGDELKVLFTPGHSPASISFYNQPQQFVIAGDVLFMESIGRTDLPGADHETLLTTAFGKSYLPSPMK